jgi:hypothetical protein
MLIHMVEETARHAGHLDVIPELLDGQKGYLLIQQANARRVVGRRAAAAREREG